MAFCIVRVVCFTKSNISQAYTYTRAQTRTRKHARVCFLGLARFYTRIRTHTHTRARIRIYRRGSGTIHHLKRSESTRP